MTAKLNIREMNLLISRADPELAIQHFPTDWAEANLPREQRLIENGLT